MKMRLPELRRRLAAALLCVKAEAATPVDGKYARGLAREGYCGGYGQALRDVLALMDGGRMPNTRNYWSQVEPMGIRKTQHALAGRITSALEKVKVEMGSSGIGATARGMAAEGYAGGYAQALRDTVVLMAGHQVPSTRGFWAEQTPPTVAAKD